MSWEREALAAFGDALAIVGSAAPWLAATEAERDAWKRFAKRKKRKARKWRHRFRQARTLIAKMAMTKTL